MESESFVHWSGEALSMAQSRSRSLRIPQSAVGIDFQGKLQMVRRSLVLKSK